MNVHYKYIVTTNTVNVSTYINMYGSNHNVLKVFEDGKMHGLCKTTAL